MAKKTEDVYLTRVQAQTDPILRKAQERILRAARAVLEAQDLLGFASKELEHHPDFAKTEVARQTGKPLDASLTPAWWMHNGIQGVLADASLADAAEWLFEDSNPRRLASSLRAFQATAERDRARLPRVA